MLLAEYGKLGDRRGLADMLKYSVVRLDQVRYSFGRGSRWLHIG